ncbi:MAG: hypothetical protein VXZ38_08385 [Planctomycetota bacterium]|nr:hypothetical protein [Planctomycetota bacterium]
MALVCFRGRREGEDRSDYRIEEEFKIDPILDLQGWIQEARDRGWKPSTLLEVVTVEVLEDENGGGK